MNYSHVLFDLDGTLTDPKIGITKSVQYALSRMDIVEENLDKLIPFIGPPLASSFMETYHFSAAAASQAVQYYREYFVDKGMYENEPYPEIMELLDMLVAQQRTLIVATSKPTLFAERILEHFNMNHYFQWIIGSNLDGTMSDKTEIIKHIMETKQLEASSTVMIGDRKHDIIGAHNNRIASIGVGYGYGSEEELTAVKPTCRVSSVKELLTIFA